MVYTLLYMGSFKTSTAGDKFKNTSEALYVAYESCVAFKFETHAAYHPNPTCKHTVEYQAMIKEIDRIKKVFAYMTRHIFPRMVEMGCSQESDGLDGIADSLWTDVVLRRHQTTAKLPPPIFVVDHTLNFMWDKSTHHQCSKKTKDIVTTILTIGMSGRGPIKVNHDLNMFIWKLIASFLSSGRTTYVRPYPKKIEYYP